LEADFPPKLKPIFDPYRYKVLYGGRGGAKSWGFARALLILGAQKPIRILCAREVQNSISDSVHQLLEDQIPRLGLENFYTVQKTTIMGKNGTTFGFEGLRHNINSLKSYEGTNICWVENTLIDGRPIQEIEVGDFVSSYNHKTKKIESRKVIKTFKSKKPQEIYKLIYAGGRCIIGTGNHPIYVVGEGYIPLKNLTKGKTIYVKETRLTRKSTLSRRVQRDNRNKYSWKTTELCKKWGAVLLGLRTHQEQQENETKQSDGQSRGKSKNGAYLKQQERWKWERVYQITGVTLRQTWAWLVERASYNNGNKANKLQSRFSKCLLQASHRVRRESSSWEESKIRRREKKQILTEYRVDSVEIQKQEDTGRTRTSDGRNYVYNLEVEVNNNYFANDVLVHNCWVEEAHSVSKRSWDVLIPTIRKKNSEIWMTFNPELAEDETYKRFVLNPPANTLRIEMSYKDNPYFPEVLAQEMQEMKIRKPLDYENIWLGIPRQAVEGAVWAHELDRIHKEGRITKVPYDESHPVSTYWDLGHSDQTAIWFIQQMGFEYRVLDAYANSHQKLHHYLKIVKDKEYNYSGHFLPHDAKAKTLAADKTVEQQVRDVLRNVSVVPQGRISDGIEQVRLKLPLCYFDADKCTDGLTALRKYAFKKDLETGRIGKNPEHNIWSHYADGFRTFAMAPNEYGEQDVELPSAQDEEDELSVYD